MYHMIQYTETCGIMVMVLLYGLNSMVVHNQCNYVKLVGYYKIYIINSMCHPRSNSVGLLVLWIGVSKNTGKPESKNRKLENRGPGSSSNWKKPKTKYPDSNTQFLAPGYYRVTGNQGTTYIYNYILIFFSLGLSLMKSSLGT